MINILLGGLGAGLILSLLTGPAFFSLIRTSIEKGFKAGVAFAFGVFSSDALYIALTFIGARAIQIAEEYKLYIAIIGGIFLILVGIRYLTKKIEIKYDANIPVNVKHNRYFFKGFLMNFLNPGMFFYWIGVATVLTVDDNYTLEETIAFLGTTLATVLIVDLTKAYIANRIRHMFSTRIILWMNRLVGSALIIFAIVMIVKVALVK
jgi:threonine/homoserine/homoserine lactone efflux protein